MANKEILYKEDLANSHLQFKEDIKKITDNTFHNKNEIVNQLTELNDRLDAEDDLYQNADEVREANSQEYAQNELNRKAKEEVMYNNYVANTIKISEIERAERERIARENIRLSNENARVKDELQRKANETVREANEKPRIASETERIDAENIRIANEEKRIANQEKNKTDLSNSVVNIISISDSFQHNAQSKINTANSLYNGYFNELKEKQAFEDNQNNTFDMLEINEDAQSEVIEDLIIGDNVNSINEQNIDQDDIINANLMAVDELYTMLEPFLTEETSIYKENKEVSKLVELYVAMVMRGLKTIEQVPVRYREEVRKILNELEK